MTVSCSRSILLLVSSLVAVGWGFVSAEGRNLVTASGGSKFVPTSKQLAQLARDGPSFNGRANQQYPCWKCSQLFVAEPSKHTNEDSTNDALRVRGGAQSSATTSPNGGPMRLESALFATYFCNTFLQTLPVVLMPLIAYEKSQLAGPGFSSAAFIASVASLSTMGGGVGKFVNGFVCQALGGKLASSLYFTVMASAIFLLSALPLGEHVGWFIAAVDFTASIQWTAASYILSNYYENNPEKFAAGITVISLAGTCGTLSAKMGGLVLLQFLKEWRMLARVGGAVALTGSLVMRLLVSEYPAKQKPPTRTKMNLGDIGNSFRAVLGSRFFWLVGLAHATTFLGRTSDRVLAPYFQEVTGMPRHVCGALTSFITLGFVLGLSNGRTYFKLPDMPTKMRFLRKLYIIGGLSAAGMGVFAHKAFSSIPSLALAAITALLSAIMTYSLSFQFFQIPPMVATTFGNNKAVCLSFLDGLGFILSAPVWAVTGKIVAGLGDNGWSASLFMLGSFFAAGGLLMTSALPRSLDRPRKS